MFIFDKVSKKVRVGFWLDEPDHFTIFNICLMGISMLSMYVLAQVGVGFTFLGFNLTFHFPSFQKKYDEYMVAAKVEADQRERVQSAALKKRRRKK